MPTYFISDTHFGHSNILKFERTEFETIEEHDRFVIKTINATVKPTDTLIHLGDVGNLERVRELNGYKILIMGNHDKRGVKEYLGYFAQVHENPYYFNKNVFLSHEPHPVPEGVLNVHGHLHGAELNSRNHFNIGAWNIGYKPVREDALYQRAAILGKTNYKFLEEWFADKYKFLLPKDDVEVFVDGTINLEKTKGLQKIKKEEVVQE